MSGRITGKESLSSGRYIMPKYGSMRTGRPFPNAPLVPVNLGVRFGGIGLLREISKEEK